MHVHEVFLAIKNKIFFAFYWLKIILKPDSSPEISKFKVICVNFNWRHFEVDCWSLKDFIPILVNQT